MKESLLLWLSYSTPKTNWPHNLPPHLSPLILLLLLSLPRARVGWEKNHDGSTRWELGAFNWKWCGHRLTLLVNRAELETRSRWISYDVVSIFIILSHRRNTRVGWINIYLMSPFWSSWPLSLRQDWRMTKRFRPIIPTSSCYIPLQSSNSFIMCSAYFGDASRYNLNTASSNLE